MILYWIAFDITVLAMKAANECQLNGLFTWSEVCINYALKGSFSVFNQVNHLGAMSNVLVKMPFTLLLKEDNDIVYFDITQKF